MASSDGTAGPGPAGRGTEAGRKPRQSQAAGDLGSGADPDESQAASPAEAEPSLALPENLAALTPPEGAGAGPLAEGFLATKPATRPARRRKPVVAVEGGRAGQGASAPASPKAGASARKRRAAQVKAQVAADASGHAGPNLGAEGEVDLAAAGSAPEHRAEAVAAAAPALAPVSPDVGPAPLARPAEEAKAAEAAPAAAPSLAPASAAAPAAHPAAAPDTVAAPAPPAAPARDTAAAPASSAALRDTAAPARAPDPEPAASVPADPAHATPRSLTEALADATQLPERMTANIARIEELSGRLMAALAQKKPVSPGVQGPGPDLYRTAAEGWMKAALARPEKMLQAQTRYWAETLRLFSAAQGELARGSLTAPADEGPTDPRFKNPLWTQHPFFNLVRRQYQINAAAMSKAVAGLEIDDPTARRRIGWFTRQMIDMMAPTNFLATNPDALERALETEGESLVRGMENLVADVERHGGEVMVSLVDDKAFRVGENIATSQGTVVARTDLYELIQYAPTTDRVHKLPLILFRPWINKFYILDLKPQNSLIRWLVAQGFTLFVVSWKNPEGASHGGIGLDDYVAAYLRVMDEVRTLTDEPRLNAVGYCIGGTTLSLALALLEKRGDDRVNSATFFTTLTDFSETGEFTTFLQDDFLGGIDEEVGRTGVLGAQLMARTFSFLRANDLIWGPAIRSYMLGETPPAFDLLYWNADATNLPGRMAQDYLRGLCQSNLFAGDEGYEVLGERVRLADVTLPVCSVACEGDHIAPWLDCWRGFSMTGSEDRTFLLSQSGHIAGIINPPTRVKYGHYTSEAGFGGTAQDWRAAADFHEGSWWPSWLAWLAPRSGAQVAARVAGEGLAPAPGTYVHEAAR